MCLCVFNENKDRSLNGKYWVPIRIVMCASEAESRELRFLRLTSGRQRHQGRHSLIRIFGTEFASFVLIDVAMPSQCQYSVSRTVIIVYRVLYHYTLPHTYTLPTIEQTRLSIMLIEQRLDIINTIFVAIVEFPNLYNHNLLGP